MLYFNNTGNYWVIGNGEYRQRIWWEWCTEMVGMMPSDVLLFDRKLERDHRKPLCLILINNLLAAVLLGIGLSYSTLIDTLRDTANGCVVHSTPWHNLKSNVTSVLYPFRRISYYTAQDDANRWLWFAASINHGFIYVILFIRRRVIICCGTNNVVVQLIKNNILPDASLDVLTDISE